MAPLLDLHPLQTKRREHRYLKPGKAHLRWKPPRGEGQQGKHSYNNKWYR